MQCLLCSQSQSQSQSQQTKPVQCLCAVLIAFEYRIKFDSHTERENLTQKSQARRRGESMRKKEIFHSFRSIRTTLNFHPIATKSNTFACGFGPLFTHFFFFFFLVFFFALPLCFEYAQTTDARTRSIERECKDYYNVTFMQFPATAAAFAFHSVP